MPIEQPFAAEAPPPSVANGRPVSGPSLSEPTSGHAFHGRERPLWDADRRELLRGQTVVKRYCVPAPSQEAVLAAFEQAGWPARISNPFPEVDEQDPIERLHQTLRALNRNQLVELVHFRGDGTGGGVLWELTTPEERHRRARKKKRARGVRAGQRRTPK